MTQLELDLEPGGSGVLAPRRRAPAYLFAFLLAMMLVIGGFAARSGQASEAFAGLPANSAAGPPIQGKDQQGNRPIMTNPNGGGSNSNKSVSAPSVPLNDAFHLLSPCNISVTQGQTFTLDLLVNASAHTSVAQQAYMTFTNSLLEVIPTGGTCGQSATTVQLDGTTFEVSLQNVVSNTIGEIAFASGTFGAGGSGQFRVARLHFCAEGSGTAQINWQFSPPAPPQRNTGITDVDALRIENRALYQNCTVTITGGATATAGPPTNTPAPPSGTPVPPTSTSAPPTATQASTSTTIPPTNTTVPPTSTSVPSPPPPPPPTATPPRPAATPTATPRPNAPTATPLPAGSRYFPETKHTVKGLFLNYWNTHGGLPQQGYPITEELQEQSDTNGKVYTMQYFERAVFEHHPEYAAPYNVLLSLLGNFYYNEKYAGNTPNQRASTNNPLKFRETGKTIGGAFRKYWETHGGR